MHSVQTSTGGSLHYYPEMRYLSIPLTPSLNGIQDSVHKAAVGVHKTCLHHWTLAPHHLIEKMNKKDEEKREEKGE